MRNKTICGALLVSAALCSQGFGFELLDRMLGVNSGGNGGCSACANGGPCNPATKACCPEPTACGNACPQPVASACGQAGCGTNQKCRRTPVRDLFAGMADLFAAKGCESEPQACGATTGCGPESASCANPAGCGPTSQPVRQPKCHKLYRRPALELLEGMFGTQNCGCGSGCGTDGQTACGCGGVAPAPAGKAAPTTAPAKAPEAAPLPAAPKADPSAAVHSRGIYQASRALARN